LGATAINVGGQLLQGAKQNLQFVDNNVLKPLNTIFDTVLNAGAWAGDKIVPGFGENLKNGLFVASMLIGGGEERLLYGAAETAQPLALGLKDAGLEQFAQARGATLATGENWQTTVTNALNDPNTTVHFNLDQVDVWQGVQRAASGQGGPTDWELLQIRQNPQSWDTLQFWEGGQSAPNPFK
jgi:hypothetical protein